MLSWIILILVLALFSVLGTLLASSIFGRGETQPPMPDTENVKAANRRAVEDGNFDDIQLEVVHRGYRMDQVDALIAQLTGQDTAEWRDDETAEARPAQPRNPQKVDSHSLTEGVSAAEFEAPATLESAPKAGENPYGKA
ncbi:cell division protein DivIVA [Corynebacterium gottingense]|uniref:cell division protein DivIVA n=1 Tax=Corynebacterium gottingense TaxID=2041036 RepID=UPI0038D13A5B